MTVAIAAETFKRSTARHLPPAAKFAVFPLDEWLVQMAAIVNDTQFDIRGLISSKQNFVDYSKTEFCETVDIHIEVPRHVECACLLSKLNVK